MTITQLSENSLIILFEQEIQPGTIIRIRQAVAVIEHHFSDCIIDIIPAYASIHITFNILKLSGEELIERLQRSLIDTPPRQQRKIASKLIVIPVYYGLDVGWDLTQVAQHNQLSIDQVVQRHSQTVYRVYAVGFAPGFAYLGVVDQTIACPRKLTPRVKVPQGSVAIAEQQTAVYPAESPGGWQIIGRTPMSMIDYSLNDLTPFAVGDQVKFEPITKTDYLNLGGTIQ